MVRILVGSFYLALALGWCAATASAYSVSLVGPSSASPGDVIEVEVIVDTEGSGWRGFGVYVWFDPVLLRPVSGVESYAPGMIPGSPYSFLSLLHPHGWFVQQSSSVDAPAYAGVVATLVFDVMCPVVSTYSDLDLSFREDHGLAGFFLGEGAVDVTSQVVLNHLAVYLIPPFIDIRPGSDTNPVNPFSRGLIPVAILSSETFDAQTVDPTSLLFGVGGTWAAPVCKKGGHVQDVNDDGLMDLLSHYRIQETGIAMGDTEAWLYGETFDGTPLWISDSINTQPPGHCGIGYELAFLLPPLVWMRQRRRRRTA